ncbi:serine/threonine protein kinase related protein [Bacteroides reticulotermitis JCM 10512]|uniref:Serine/threonine protein kinase related protein n=1 Tax=Bacteroides reticulotermitis JCM 10512 TaxID=1445607 RepID=W4UW03_9BACE|nr:serine/threonine protein kinase related protein [Bacteroides reticulotermitis JCM 10512]
MFGSTKEGVIFAVKAKSGEVVWIYKVGNSLVNTVLPIGSQKLLFTTTNGEVGLLNWRN